MFLDRVIHFGVNLGDQVKGRSPKMLKSLIRVPYVPYVKVQILSFIRILISSPWRVPRPSYPFPGKILGCQVKDRSPKKVKSLIDLCSAPESTSSSFNVILISSPYCVTGPSYPFRGKFGRSFKESFNEKAKIVDRGSLCNAPESTGSTFQYDGYLNSVVCS